MGERKTWIDALRALAIIMVVLGHQVKGEDAYFLFTSPVKMPLFFCNFRIFEIIKTIWGVFICNICAMFVNKYIPELVGKKRHVSSSDN